MYIEAILVPLIFGKIRGGKLINLSEINIKFLWLILVSGIIETLSSFIRRNEIEPFWQVIEGNKLYIQLIVYMLLIICMIYNLNNKAFRIILVGIILNFIVIMANGGQMPVDISLIQQNMSYDSIEYLKSGKDLVHVMADENTTLLILGDIIHLTKPYPFSKSISIGDIFLIGGIGMYIYSHMFVKGENVNEVAL